MVNKYSTNNKYEKSLEFIYVSECVCVCVFVCVCVCVCMCIHVRYKDRYFCPLKREQSGYVGAPTKSTHYV